MIKRLKCSRPYVHVVVVSEANTDINKPLKVYAHNRAYNGKTVFYGFKSCSTPPNASGMEAYLYHFT